MYVLYLPPSQVLGGFWNEFTRRFGGDANISHQKSVVFVLMFFSTFFAG